MMNKLELVELVLEAGGEMEITVGKKCTFSDYAFTDVGPRCLESISDYNYDSFEEFANAVKEYIKNHR